MNRILKVENLARVEGEGGLYIKMSGGAVKEVRLNIFEPPRFFEAFLKGRHCTEAPDLTARICGICPIAYQMSSVHAMENALGIKVEGQLRELRRLIYCGEWIESHALHIYMLHAPDFLGYHNVVEMAKDHPDTVKNALRLKKAGNAIVATLGGREIHPINVRVGGFYRAPERREFNALLEDLKWARDAARETVRWTAKLEFPDFEMDYDFVAMRHPAEYPFNEGEIASSKRGAVPVSAFEEHYHEEHVKHSNALHCATKEGGAYQVGPLARFNLNFARLTPASREAAKEAGLDGVCKNPFKSIIVRAVETLYACEEAIRVIEQYEKPEKPFVEFQPRAGTGTGGSEAPRGMLYHRYRLDAKGMIQEARIVPPTSQNQKCIEDDLLRFVTANASLPDAELTHRCEQAIRNYDPCISCATHFLRLKVDRG